MGRGTATAAHHSRCDPDHTGAPEGLLDSCGEQEGGSLDSGQEIALLASIFIALLLTCGLGSAMRAGRTGNSIPRRPYNNRYNDATGARQDRLG